MSLRQLSILAAVAGASALVAPVGGELIGGQTPLGGHSAPPVSPSDFKCDLPPAIDPSADGLPSADELFSSDKALAKQIERHQAIVRVPSVSYDDLGEPGEDERWAPFFDLHKVLEVLFPNIYERATVEKVNTLGLVYTIQGSNPSLKPTLLTAHQDVVPVPDESTWTHPPFAAVYDGEWLWGRGASDDKNSLTALMSAVDTLLANKDWTPTRTLILAFGFDEECSGPRGAGSIGKFLTERYGDNGIAIILDEGGLGLELLNNDTLYALPSVIEKGHIDIWLELSVVGGHSSIPFPHTGIGIMAELISALEAHPYTPQLLPDSPMHRHLQCQARYSPKAQPEITRLVRAGDLDALSEELARMHRSAHYMIQTSQSVDVIAGGQKINAMPEHVRLGVNYRVAPQDSLVEIQHNVVEHIRGVVEKYSLDVKAYEGDAEYEEYLASKGSGEPVRTWYDVDYNGTLTIQASEKFNVTPIAPTSGPVWETFSGTIQHSFAFDGGKVIPVGEIMTGNTDTRRYLNLSPHIYRWAPISREEAINIHTIDERVLMSAHVNMVKFYYDFVRNLDQADF